MFVYLHIIKNLNVMTIQIETILDHDSMGLVNLVIGFVDSKLNTLPQLEVKLRNHINYRLLHTKFICGSGGNHVWLSRVSDGERILLITE